jgi:predicted component of type VI protein secretion system
MKLTLVVLAAGKQEGKTFEIKVPQFLIGRDPQCQLRPASPMISKRHCALITKDGKVYLKDFGSTNGSFVNDQPVKNAVQLKHGDKLKIGPLFFQVHLEVDEPAEKANPAPAAAAAQAGKATPQAAGKPAPTKQAPQPASAAKGAAASSSTPPADAEPNLDDDIAALLLGGGPTDDTVSDTPSASDDIPQGTTVFDLPVPKEDAPAGELGPDGQPKKPEPPKQPPMAPDTRSAAAAILEQMRKRPRS